MQGWGAAGVGIEGAILGGEEGAEAVTCTDSLPPLSPAVTAPPSQGGRAGGRMSLARQGQQVAEAGVVEAGVVEAGVLEAGVAGVAGAVGGTLCMLPPVLWKQVPQIPSQPPD